MPQSNEAKVDKNPVSQNPHWKLVERVTAGSALKNSPRLQQLLRYLCERALSEPGSFISEQQVGTEVFGREPGYNSGEDTIVRTQVSQLRKRLLQYFLSDGREEPITIEIPIGSYMPLFHPRKEIPQPETREAESTSGTSGSSISAAGTSAGTSVSGGQAASPWTTRMLWVVVVLLLVACGVLVWQNSRLRAERIVASPRTPYLDHLWKQLLDNGQQTDIVASDGNAMFFSDFMDKPITVDEYREENYPDDLIKKWITTPEARTMMGHFMSTYFTGSQDTFAVARLTAIGERYKIPTEVVYARNFRWRPQTDNVILLGHAKANPWVEQFDNQLNFTYEWHLESRKGLLRNRNPKPGENETYQWNIPPNSTYATVSYVPTQQGSVLIFSGTDMTAVDAGSRFLSDEESVHKLHTQLSVDLGRPVPHFEALIVARRARNLAYEPQLISTRVLK